MTKRACRCAYCQGRYRFVTNGHAVRVQVRWLGVWTYDWWLPVPRWETAVLAEAQRWVAERIGRDRRERARHAGPWIPVPHDAKAPTAAPEAGDAHA